MSDDCKSDQPVKSHLCDLHMPRPAGFGLEMRERFIAAGEGAAQASRSSAEEVAQNFASRHKQSLYRTSRTSAADANVFSVALRCVFALFPQETPTDTWVFLVPQCVLVLLAGTHQRGVPFLCRVLNSLELLPSLALLRGLVLQGEWLLLSPLSSRRTRALAAKRDNLFAEQGNLTIKA